jgi:hypothetical protein
MERRRGRSDWGFREPAYAVCGSSSLNEAKSTRKLDENLLGATGGASPIRKTNGIEAVEMMPRSRIFIQVPVHAHQIHSGEKEEYAQNASYFPG